MERHINVASGTSLDIQNDLIPELKNISANQSKFSSLTLFIVTIILFFSAQIISAKWQEIAILIGVLLFHELGHFGAMKLFKYNDVKMFFIPLIGAAVSGKSQKDTAVKSCLVSLMGPLPGILMGVFLYFMFTLTKNYYVFKIAQVMLLLNAFNFLPIMPLDGGRFVDVLFVDRRLFRLLFATLGAAIFLALAVFLKDFVIGLVGLFVLMGAFSSFKLHGISNVLKSEGIAATSVNDLLDNHGHMQVAVEKLRVGYPKLFEPAVLHKAIFNSLTTIVDTIKFVPAKLFSKILLLMFYSAMVSASVLVTVFFMAANYRETARTAEISGVKYVYAERHLFGRKISECLINDALFYDGKGTVFGSDKNSASGEFYYSNGYRTGEWLTFNEKGETIEKKAYRDGQLLSLSVMEQGAWKTLSYEELPFLKKFSEEVQRISQPFKSNYKYFER